MFKDATNDFNNWLKALKSYKKDPSKFLGRPKMPGYIKSDIRTTCLTNQDCTIKNGILKFSLTKAVIEVPQVPDDAKLVEIKIKPYYGNFMIICTIETESVSVTKDRPFMAGIDFGVDNTAAIVTNEGHTLLFQGGALKSMNQYFNKERARLISCITVGHKTEENVTSKRLRKSFHAP